MIKKYKISELAKDLKVASKDLIAILKKYFKKPPKTTTNLSDEEANIALELYSQKNQVENFNEYFSSAKEIKNIEKRDFSSELDNKNKNGAKNSKQTENIIDKDNFKPLDEQIEEKKDEKKDEKKSFGGKQNVSIKIVPRTDKVDRKIIYEEENKNFVETKTSHVNVEKYDERYENIAVDSSKIKGDSFLEKQRFKKRIPQKNSRKKETESQKNQRLALEKARKQKLKVTIPDKILVSELASIIKTNVSKVIKKLIELGIMANVNEIIDFDTASLVATEFGAEVEHEISLTLEERLFEESKEKEEDLEKRDPVVVVVGHVDHGKTSLLDKIRNTNIISSEAGGITQHIGAYQVNISKDKAITFLDTPGHEAFTAMRMRGVNITDIAVLVVAADDGVMPQTKEAIDHVKAAGVSIIVAINKIDKPQANVEKIKQELTEHGLVPEEWGGDVICVPMSAKTGEGIEELLEMIDLVAQIKELKASRKTSAKGTIIESYLDKGRGPVATLLVQMGTLKLGDIIIAGMAVGRVRTMLNYKGKKVDFAGPSAPVEITGLSEVPLAGEVFNVVADEKLARELVEKRKYEEKNQQFESHKVSLENIFSKIKEGEHQNINIIVKGDVFGSVEALKNSLLKLSTDQVTINIIHGAVGAIIESDIMLAEASKAVVVGFNVRPNAIVKSLAQEKGVEIRLYRVIYDIIDDLGKAIKGKLAPKQREVELGTAEVRQIYRISNIGIIAGCYVTSGKILRKANVRLVRDSIVIAQDSIKSLRRFKEDVKEVLKEFECGIGLEKFNDIKIGDIFESFIVENINE